MSLTVHDLLENGLKQAQDYVDADAFEELRWGAAIINDVAGHLSAVSFEDYKTNTLPEINRLLQETYANERPTYAKLMEWQKQNSDVILAGAQSVFQMVQS